MSTRIGESVERRTPESDAAPMRTTRVDPGHVPANGSADASPAASSAVATNTAPVDAALAADDVHTMVGAKVMANDLADERAALETHARQLGMELDRRQSELDAREEELNRRAAELDQELRRSRMWLDERRQELEEREAVLSTARSDVEARLSRVVANERELQFARREKQSADKKEAAEQMVPESAFVPMVELVAAPAAQANLALAEQLATRERHLKESESLAAAEHEALAEGLRRLDEEKVAWKAFTKSERETWDKERARQNAAIERRHVALIERAQQLDARSESLEQLQHDLAANQRETLELRVAVQELWLQLSGRMPPAAMMQAIAESRAKLAANYRASVGQFDAAEKRLRTAAEQLAKQVSEVKQQRSQFQTWADERQTSIERQAARLVAREQELEAQDQMFRDRERTWSEQKLAYRREIRRLLGELRERDCAEGLGRD